MIRSEKLVFWFIKTTYVSKAGFLGAVFVKDRKRDFRYSTDLTSEKSGRQLWTAWRTEGPEEQWDEIWPAEGPGKTMGVSVPHEDTEPVQGRPGLGGPDSEPPPPSRVTADKSFEPLRLRSPLGIEIKTT